MPLREKVSDTIKKYSMLSGGETVLVGLSGGPDSVCLLNVLHAISPDMKLKLHALYVDHGLRPDETPNEIDFCGDLAGNLGAPFSVKTVDVKAYAKGRGLGTQDAARALRHEAFEDAALEVGADAVALGHNLDDQAETFMMHVLRGSGPRGLAGIPPVRGKIIRPLIEVERREIEAYLDAEGISYMLDSSNLRRDYLRNRLRFSVMPALKEANPSLLDTISRTTEILREEDRFLETQVTKALMKLITRKTPASIELFLVPLLGMERVVLRRVLRRAVEAVEGLSGISFMHIEDIMHLIKTGSPGDRLSLPRDVRAILKYSTLLVTSEPPRTLSTYAVNPGDEVVLKEAGLVLTASSAEESPAETDRDTAVLDADRLSLPLTVRARKDGDYFHPEGFGKRKKLQDFFVDEKVPRDERGVVPVVASGEDIAWVAGMRADSRFAASPSTRRFVVLKLKRLRD